MKDLRKWKKQWLIVISVVLFFLISVVIPCSVFIYTNIQKTYKPVKKIPSNITQIDKQQEDDNVSRVETYLILGIDSSTNDIGRTDTIIVAIINDFTKKITIVSIPRDTYVEIAGKNYKDKINHAYQYGLETTIATVENFTMVSIDNYVLFTLDGYVKAVDAIGGIKVDIDINVAKASEKDLSPENRLFEGEMLLDGEQALYFARFRSDSNGDYGRNDRQQKVLKAFLDQSKSFVSPIKIKELLEILGKDVCTDIAFKEMFDLALMLRNYTSEDIIKITYNGYSDRFGEQNLWYVIIPEEEQARVAAILKDSQKSK